MKKAIQLLAQAAVLFAMIYAVLWLAKALGDLACALIPW